LRMYRSLRIFLCMAILAITAAPQASYRAYTDLWVPVDPSALEWASFVANIDRFNRKLAGCPPEG